MTEVSATADAAVEELEQARQRLRHSARAAMGVTGEGAAPRFRSVLSRPGVSAYPLVALGLLAIVDQFQSYGVSVLGPEISRDVGTSRSTLALLIALTAVATTGASLPMAALVARRPRRALVAVVTAFAWALTTLFTGFVTSTLALAAVLILDGVSSASVLTVHTPLLIDFYPPDVRVRVLGGYRAIGQASAVVAPALVGMLTAWGDLTWRGVFLVMGIMAVAIAAFSVRLRDPGFGRWDAARLAEVVRTDAGTGPGEGTTAHDEEVPLRTGEIARRLLAVPTLRRLFAALAVLGMFVFPLQTFISFFLDEEWGLGPTGRSVFFAVMPLFSIGVILAYARRAEALFRQDPARLVRVGAVFFAASTVFTVISVFSPTFPMMVVFYAIHAGFVGFLLPAFGAASLGITPPRLRPHATALGGIFVAGVGGVSGSLLLGGLDRRYGTPVAVAVLAIPGLAAAALLYRAAATVDADLDRTVDDLVDAEEVRSVRAKGGRLPLLSCHKVDFAYDKTQVLFGVDLSVEEAELLALLGTNGAGKSTVLRVLAGLGFPSSGTVRLDGRDVTFVDPERRLELGVLFIPSGRSVFRSLSVIENLNVFGYVHGSNRAAVAAGVEASFEAFPALHANRHRRAGVLSGGQQQMLGLAQAFIVRPRVLLVDELSLGLAPTVVTELLANVRRLNAEGTTVVLVEQSVTTALQVASRAVFMEKGCIRFDGDPQRLWERSDLLRPVFLAAPGAEPAP